MCRCVCVGGSEKVKISLFNRCRLNACCLRDAVLVVGTRLQATPAPPLRKLRSSRRVTNCPALLGAPSAESGRVPSKPG